jgi:hypothetical protein
LIISITQLMVIPLLAPTLLALFMPRLGVSTIWATVGLCFPLGLIGKFTDAFAGTWLSDSTVTGVLLPIAIIGVMYLFSKKEAPGWSTIRDLEKQQETREQPVSSTFPALIVSVSLAACALSLFAMIAFNETHRGMLAGFGIGLLVLATAIYALVNFNKKNVQL